jgi:hypothetical protein
LIHCHILPLVRLYFTGLSEEKRIKPQGNCNK